MTPFELFAGDLRWLTAVAVVFGLTVGSFLNVVAHRLPVMLERRWRRDCLEYLEQPADPAAPAFNLVTPRSRCPRCGRTVRAHENIPVLSWIALRGRCAGCQGPISARYPLVELLTGIAFGVVAWRFGWGMQLAPALLLSAALIALALIDLDHQLLPDDITLPLLWCGLLASTLRIHVDPVSAILGAAAGYLVLWTVFHAFRLATGKEGLGQGDFKLLAALGAWLGWQALPTLILLASAVGATVGIARILSGHMRREQTMPFGPYLAGAGWIALVWGDVAQHALTALVS